MALYKLRLIRNGQPGETVSFVIRAGSETRARELACGQAGRVWLDPARTTCLEVEADERIVLSSRIKGEDE